MLFVVLNILKIIGIILLSILGLILLILCLILFVPIRYKIDITKKDSENNLINIKGQITYLLHLVSLKICYPETANTKFKILFFTIYPKKTKAKKVKNSKSKNSSISKNIEPIEKESTIEVTNDNTIIEEKDKNIAFQSTDYINNINQNINRNLDNINISFFEKLKDKVTNLINKIKEVINGIIFKLKNLRDNTEYYLNIINGQPFKNSVKLLKKELKKIFKIILPRSIKGYLDYGANDPSVTANIFGVYSIIYPYLGNKFNFNPYLQDEIFRCDITLKGHIRIISLLIIGIKLYFNKNIKKTLGLFKKEK